MEFDAKVIAKTIVFVLVACVALILLYDFVRNGIEWTGFIEFIASCLLMIFLVERVNVSIPGLFEIKSELGEIRKNLSVVAKNISNVKIDNRITNVTPTSYEGPPLDIDETSGTWTTATTGNPFDQDDEEADQNNT